MRFHHLFLLAFGLASSPFVYASPQPQAPEVNPLPKGLPSLFPPGNETLSPKTYIQLTPGPFNVSVTSFAHFPNRTVYLPLGTRRERIPILAWENGICYYYGRMYAAFLTEIASHGYLVIAPGTPYNWTKGYSNSTFMAKTIDLAQDWDTDDVDIRIDSRSVAIGGHSCGGMSTISLASRDARVTTALVLNSAAQKKSQLDTITASSLWIHGGVMDRNVSSEAEKNFAYLRANRTGVAAFKAVMQTGHLGTYWQPRGGLYAETVVHWLNWQLKNEDEGEAFFAGGKSSGASKRGFAVDSINI